ncbi:MAG: hypothetical protein ACYC61_07295 [Isosphaeraceae bacterium]
MKRSPGRRSPALIGVDRLEYRSLLSGLAHIDVAGPPVPADISRPADHGPLARPADRPSAPVSIAGSAHHHGRGPAETAAVQPPATVRRWSWLAGSYWYVPDRNLAATLYNSGAGTITAVQDQTVFQITGYRDGYFWGKTVTQLGGSSASGSAMVGSVTPQGRVLLTFTPMSGGSSTTVTDGYGTMQRKRGGWTMENQMFTSPVQTLQIGHWAYMVQTRPGLPSWTSLPGSGLTVPAFLNQVEGSGPVPTSP